MTSHIHVLHVVKVIYPPTTTTSTIAINTPRRVLVCDAVRTGSGGAVIVHAGARLARGGAGGPEDQNVTSGLEIEVGQGRARLLGTVMAIVRGRLRQRPRGKLPGVVAVVVVVVMWVMMVVVVVVVGGVVEEDTVLLGAEAAVAVGRSA